VNWHRFSHWRAWCLHVQPDGDVRGPDTSTLHSKVAVHPAAERQKNIAGSKATPMTRLPRDLSEDEHIKAALQLDHPYAAEPRLDIDAQFVVELCARLGPTPRRGVTVPGQSFAAWPRH